jgi:hypothetical protein
LKACKRAGIRHLPQRSEAHRVRNLERAGVPRSAAMKMVGHKTEAIYRRYSIVECEGARRGGDQAGRVASERSNRDAEGRDGVNQTRKVAK